MRAAALGFRAHTGWAAMVALAGDAADPKVIDRRRIELSASQEDAAAYHAARERDLSAARDLVTRAIAEARSRARTAIDAVVESLHAQGWRVVGVGVVLGNAALPAQLEKILASHALVHAAEGQLFRDVLIAASEGRGLTVTGIAASDLYREAARGLDLDDRELARRLVALGKAAGRPWAQDQKEAALVAWQALVRSAHAP
jgi:hypothetical protein